MNFYTTNMRASDGSVIRLEHHESLVSTVNLAKMYANMAYPDRYVVITENRIRLDSEGKSCGYDKGIFMSCILRPSIFPSQAPLLNPLTAVSLLQGLEDHTEQKLGIGWVGKIYCNGKVIGETAIEGKLDSFTSYEYLIVSFSCLLDKDNFPLRISDLIKKVFSESETTVPLIIASDILNKFFLHYKDLKNTTEFMDIYKQKFVLRGLKVAYDDNNKKRHYKVMGIDMKTCSLLLEGRDKKVFSVSTPTKVELPKRISF